MDYSLIVGVHDTERVDSEPEDELDGDDYETGEDSADGLDEPSSPNDDMDGRGKIIFNSPNDDLDR